MGVSKGDLLIGRGVESSVHRANATNKANTENEPWVHGHEAVRPTVGVKRASSNTNDTNTKSSVHESLVQEATLVSGHSAVLAGLAVEDEVGGQDGAANDGTAVQQLLRDVARRSVEGLLHVCAAEGILEGLARLGEDGGGSCGGLGGLGGLDRRVVNETSSV